MSYKVVYYEMILVFQKYKMNIQSCKADERACGVTMDDLSFKSASRSVNEFVFLTVVKIMMWYVDEQKCVVYA